MTDDIEAQLQAVFREEAAETFDALRVTFGRLRNVPVQQARTEIASAVRHAHNLKGAAASVGLSSMNETAHALEDAMLALQRADGLQWEEGLALFERTLSGLEASLDGADDALLGSLREQLGALTSALGTTRHAEDEPPGQDAHSPHPPADAEPEASDVHGETSAVEMPAVQEVGWRSSSVRVETARLDRLFGFVSEILGTSADMEQRQQALESLRSELEGALPMQLGQSRARVLRMLDAVVDDHYRALGSFGRLASDLATAMRRARMVSLEAQAPWLRRVVADAASAVDKSVDLRLEVGDIELDRAVLDRLRDPLMHLLRNAVDHGIDDAEDRLLFGKPERGLVGLFARVRGATVELVVADDGRGFDLAAIERRAVQKGLVSEKRLEQIDEAELLDCLLAEGFSTREEANSLSGRGVGLHVVGRTVAELGGSLRAMPRGPLGGAAFALTVPLSILSTRLLLVRAGEVVCGVPVHAIQRVGRVTRTQIRQVDGVAVASIDGGASLPLQFLTRMLGQRLVREPEIIHVLVIEHAASQTAIAVDEVLGETDQVVHRLPWNLERVTGVSGAVPMVDGSVTMVVDTAHLLSTRATGTANNGPEEAKVATRVLVVDDSMTTRTLHRNLLAGAGYEVMVANDGNEAWQRLRTEVVDVVVTDVQMPGLNGFELTRRIRADRRLAAIPVLLVTSLGGPEEVQRGLDAGADEYVVKGPLEQDVLLSAVKRHAG